MRKTIAKESTLSLLSEVIGLYESGALGGASMPEDQNPGLITSSRENALYFTLPMALNYQRNSYKLWEAAKRTYEDFDTRPVFFPELSGDLSDDDLRSRLQKYGVALQPNRHIQIWRRISQAMLKHGSGDPRKLIFDSRMSVKKLRELVQGTSKADFPYLSGDKIFNYWLVVMERYSGVSFVDREEITVAPDTHVLQASIELGVLSETEQMAPDVRKTVAERWRILLAGSGRSPIDIHTPLWLWSRAGFPRAGTSGVLL